jgi:hypothetical protein
MPTLLVELQGNRSLNRTIFAPHLYIYDDLLIYRKRRLLKINEVTISYNRIAQVILTRGIFFAGMEIITTGPDHISIRFVSKKKATKAKRIIDQKIYHSHAKHRPDAQAGGATSLEYEKALNRLRELLSKEQITQREFNKRKADLLKKIG